MSNLETKVKSSFDPESSTSEQLIVQQTSNNPQHSISRRYFVVFMAFLGLFIIYGTRCNMGVHKGKILRRTEFYDKFFLIDWNTAVNIDTRRFYGEFLSSIPGGILAYKYSATKVYGCGVVISSAINFFLPFLFNVDQRVGLIFGAFYFLQGAAHGVIIPSLFGIFRFWAPPLERTKLITIALSGSFAAMFFGPPICAMLAYWINSEVMFIVFGFLGIIWFAYWHKLVFDRPQDDPKVSQQELTFIQNTLAESTKLEVQNIPWSKMLTSLPVIAIIVASFCQMWSWFLLAFYQNKFLRHNFNFKLNEDGLLTAMPFILVLIIVPLSVIFANKLHQKRTLSATNTRKVLLCVSFIVQGICFFGVSNSATATMSLLLFLISIAFSGIALASFIVNSLDIAPRYASIIVGILNTFGFFAGIICIYVTDFITSDQFEKSSWNTVFTTTSGIFVVGAIFYGIFASGELQSWAEPKVHELQNLDEDPERNS